MANGSLILILSRNVGVHNVYGMLHSIAKQLNENCNTLTIDERCLGFYIFSGINSNVISLSIALLHGFHFH